MGGFGFGWVCVGLARLVGCRDYGLFWVFGFGCWVSCCCLLFEFVWFGLVLVKCVAWRVWLCVFVVVLVWFFDVCLGFNVFECV